MEFEDKYISASKQAVTPDAKKIVLSNDAYALAEAIHLFLKELKRQSMK